MDLYWRYRYIQEDNKVYHILKKKMHATTDIHRLETSIIIIYRNGFWNVLGVYMVEGKLLSVGKGAHILTSRETNKTVVYAEVWVRWKMDCIPMGV